LVFTYGALGATCLGMVVAAPFALVAHALAGPEAADAITAVVIAPMVEELTKGLIFVPLVLTAHFDNETDGLIYGAAVGLGFATVENLLYYLAAAPEGPMLVLGTVFMRSLFTSLVHCISSALLGMFVGWARHRAGPGRWLLWPLVGYLLAVINHAAWNALVTARDALGAVPVLLGMGQVAVMAMLMFALTQLSLAREHAVIRRFLAEEAQRGVLPAEHARVIPYWSRRRRRGWLPPEVPKEPYLRAATLLAFRHHQLEISRGERRQRYLQDIESLRAEVGRLLEGRSPSLRATRDDIHSLS
jgi:protease PrsW